MSDKTTWLPKGFVPQEPQWIPYQGFLLQEDSGLTEGMWIIIRGLSKGSDFAFKWFCVNSS